MYGHCKKMNEPVQSLPPSDEDIFYLKWGEETIKKNIENAHGVLTQFLTLNVSLMGGSIVFLDPKHINQVWLITSLSLFFIGLCISFVGLLPHESSVSRISPSDIKRHKQQALRKKRSFMWCCATATGGGLVVLGLGVIFT